MNEVLKKIIDAIFSFPGGMIGKLSAVIVAEYFPEISPTRQTVLTYILIVVGWVFVWVFIQVWGRSKVVASAIGFAIILGALVWALQSEPPPPPPPTSTPILTIPVGSSSSTINPTEPIMPTTPTRLTTQALTGTVATGLIPSGKSVADLPPDPILSSTPTIVARPNNTTPTFTPIVSNPATGNVTVTSTLPLTGPTVTRTATRLAPTNVTPTPTPLLTRISTREATATATTAPTLGPTSTPTRAPTIPSTRTPTPIQALTATRTATVPPVPTSTRTPEVCNLANANNVCNGIVTIRVFVDNRCNNFYNPGTDIPMANIGITVQTATQTLKTTTNASGEARITGVNLLEGTLATVSVNSSSVACPGSPNPRTLTRQNFSSGRANPVADIIFGFQG